MQTVRATETCVVVRMSHILYFSLLILSMLYHDALCNISEMILQDQLYTCNCSTVCFTTSYLYNFSCHMSVL